MAQSLKVPTTTLIANAEMARERIIAAHAKAKRDAGKMTLTEAKKQLAWQLRSLARDIDRGALNPKPSETWSGTKKAYVPHLSAGTQVEMPEKIPTKPDTEKVDRHLRLLRSTAQETVSVRTDDDFAEYL